MRLLILLVALNCICFASVMGQSIKGLQFQVGSAWNSSEIEFSSSNQTDRISAGSAKPGLKASLEYTLRPTNSSWQYRIGISSIPLAQRIQLGPLFDGNGASIRQANTNFQGGLVVGKIGYSWSPLPRIEALTLIETGLLYMNPASGTMDSPLHEFDSLNPEWAFYFLDYQQNDFRRLSPYVGGALQFSLLLQDKNRLSFTFGAGTALTPAIKFHSRAAQVKVQGEAPEAYDFSLLNRGAHYRFALGYEFTLNKKLIADLPSGSDRSFPLQNKSDFFRYRQLSIQGGYYWNYGTRNHETNNWQIVPSFNLVGSVSFRQPIGRKTTLTMALEKGTAAISTAYNSESYGLSLVDTDYLASTIGASWYFLPLESQRRFNVAAFAEFTLPFFQSFEPSSSITYSGRADSTFYFQHQEKMQVQSIAVGLGLEGSVWVGDSFVFFARGGLRIGSRMNITHVWWTPDPGNVGTIEVSTTLTGYYFNLGIGVPLLRNRYRGWWDDRL